MFGRTIRVNISKPQKAREGSSRAVWADDAWLEKYAGSTLDNNDEKAGEQQDQEGEVCAPGFI